ncbi:MAG: N-acetylneuraminate synthase family protein [Solirubrobacteraceae bacterium]
MSGRLDFNERVVVIGEVAQAHDGSLGAAHAYVDAIADAGADAVKFQTHIAAAESRTDEPWRVRFSYEDDRRYDYWKRMEFTEEQWAGLRAHAHERGIGFLSSPFSLEAVELLRRVGNDAWKIASGEVANPILLRAVAALGEPVLLSSGMSGWAELDAAVADLRAHGAGPLAVLQCTSSYPVEPERLGLNLVTELQARYECPSGLSDHSGTIYPSLATVALGGRVLEVHVTMSREQFGPDVTASVTTAELRSLVAGVRMLEAARAAPVDKDAAAADLAGMRTLFGRSLVAATALAAGHELGEADVLAKKPGDGIPPARLPELVGRRLLRALNADEVLREDDLDQAAARS